MEKGLGCRFVVLEILCQGAGHTQVTSEVKVAQSCPTLCDPIDYSPWDSPGQNTGVGILSLLWGIFPTQGSNPGLPLCWQILYQQILYQPPEKPKNTGMGSLFLLQGIFLTQDLNRGFLHGRQIPAELPGKALEVTI